MVRIHSISILEYLPQKGPLVTVKPAFHTSISRHSHDFFEMVYVVDGFCLHSVDERTTLLLEGDLFLLRPGQSHSYSGDRIVNIYNCLFDRSEIPEALLRSPALTSESTDPYRSLHLDLEERKSFHRQLAAMVSEEERLDPGWELKLRAMFVSLLVDYCRVWTRHSSAAEAQQSFNGYIAPALSHIDQHYAQHLTVREIAASAGVSPDYLTRQFRRATGITPQEYLRRFRFARAMELLQAGMPVTEVASQVGFASLCHFSREFKKEMGVSPSQYKS